MKKQLLAVFLALNMVVGGTFVPAYAAETDQQTVIFQTGTADTAETVQPQNPWDGTVDTSWYNGSKTEFDITTASQLAGLASLANSGITFEGKKINLCSDIFLNDASYQNVWIPIAKYRQNESDGKVFQGTFNGNKHTIYNMRTEYDDDGGLFGHIGEKGIVKSVTVSQGLLYSGGCIANVNEGIISFCMNNSETGSNELYSVGGICNDNYNLVYGCRNYGEVWGDSVGGIVGRNMETLSTVSQCSNDGTVGASRSASGIADSNYGWLYNCRNKGTISDTYAEDYGGARWLSGIAYNNNGYIEDCYSAGDFSGSGNSLTGSAAFNAICPDSYGKGIENCYAIPVQGQNTNGAEIVSYNEMLQTDFIKKLDRQARSVLPVWIKDDTGMNDGLPVTAADYSYYTGQCKIQPELWITNKDGVIEAKVADKEYDFQADCYYNESEPAITIADPNLAELSEQSGKRTIRLKKAGTTQINIHFDETENCSSADCQLTLKITVNSETGNTSGTNQPTAPGTNTGNTQTQAKTSLAKAVVTLSANSCSYNGKAKKPTVKSVKLGGKTLKSGTDYTVSYKNNKNIGTATVTVTGKGNYTGTAQKTFKITAKKGSKFTVGANKYKITGSSTVSFIGLKSAKTTKVTVPKTVKIGGKNFKVTAIEANSLQNKKKVTNVTIGANVTIIGKNAFANCKKLGTITIKSTRLKTVGKNALKGIKATARIKVPAKKLSSYKMLLKAKGQGKKVKIIK